MRKIFIFAAACLTIQCDHALLGEEERIITVEQNLAIPESTDDGWDVSSLDAENVDAKKIETMVRNIQADPRNLHSILIVRNNKLILEAYFNGWHAQRMHDLRSSSKSVNSILVGIAIDQHYIEDVHQRMFDFFPKYQHLNDDRKNEIRLEHLLTMTSGLEWNQSSYPNEDKRNDEGQLERSSNWLEYILSKPVVTTPGKNFVYNSGCSGLLAGVIKGSTGDHADVFAEKHLFGPLGIQNYVWYKQRDGLCNAWAGLMLRSRDMAKLGQLFLDNGKWKGNQIVSAAWVKASTTTFTGNEQQDNGYGYQWWTGKYNINNRAIRIASGRGNGGQYIFIVPDLNAVVVFTGGNYSPLNQMQPFGLMQNIILPAML